MTLRVSGKNMDVGDALRSKATDHFDTVVKKYFDGNYSGHLTLEPEGSGFSALCMVHLDSGATLQSSGYGHDAILAYEKMADTIEQRLRRFSSSFPHRARQRAASISALGPQPPPHAAPKASTEMPPPRP